MSELDEMMTVPDAARELSMSRSAIHARLVRGDMQGKRINARLWLIPRAEVERWKELGKLSPGPKRRGEGPGG